MKNKISTKELNSVKKNDSNVKYCSIKDNTKTTEKLHFWDEISIFVLDFPNLFF